MAVAAYASLVSLTHVLDNVQNRLQLHLIHMDSQLIDALQENVYFLLDFVEVEHSGMRNSEILGLWRQVAEIAFEVEDVLDLHIVAQLRRRSEGDSIDVSNSSFNQDMDRVMHKIISIKDELLVKGKEAIVRIEKPPRVSVLIDSSTSSPNYKNVIVGLDKHADQIMNMLINDEHNLQIIPIVGMGGIGKTTLARHVFNHPCVANHFYICLWSTISHQYSTQEILRDFVYDGENKESREDIAKLGLKLHKKLFGRRYLIILDDVWSLEPWFDLKTFFPNDWNGSRIIITSRLSNVVASISSQKPYLIDFLNEDESWNLLSQNIFAGEGFLYTELNKIGRDIAKSCRGLPLAIVVIGRLLAKSNMTLEYWEFVAENVSMLGNLGDDEHCLNILYLSYNNLPMHLKPCFLYMRVFPEDNKIDMSELLKLWVAEGFIKLESDKSLEEIAKEYIDDLIDRNLLFVHARTNTWEIESCGLHDFLRDLCLRESDKERLFHSPKVQKLRLDVNTCFLCCEKTTCEDPTNVPEFVLLNQSASHAHHFRCSACKKKYSQLRLVRVMNVEQFSTDLVHPTKLRSALFFLYGKVKFLSPPMLHLLWNLQNLLLSEFESDAIVLPSAIWEMPQLRHISITSAVLPEPLVTNSQGDISVTLSNLQTLRIIRNFPCTKEVINRIPNLKNLEIYHESESKGSLCNLAELHKLETLMVLYLEEYQTSPTINGLASMAFPCSLKRLELSYFRIPWEDMTAIGSLPNLEELKLYYCAQGPEWEPIEGEFLQLKGLDIGWSDLVRWSADQTHFPKLEWLRVRALRSLEEIPSSIGDIATLGLIYLSWCNESVYDSAKQIWKEQQEMGNESLGIYVNNEPILRYFPSLAKYSDEDDSNRDSDC